MEEGELVTGVQEFVCALYGKPAAKNVNALRHQLFASTRAAADSRRLPPSKNALWHHVQRANFQCYVWKQACTQGAELANPEGHGWRVQSSECTIVWSSQLPAPNALMELTQCGCTKGCRTFRCTCMRNGLLCSAACKCKECLNIGKEDANDRDEFEGDAHGSDDDISDVADNDCDDLM